MNSRFAQLLASVISHKTDRAKAPKSMALRIETLESRELLDAAPGFETTPPPQIA